MSGIATWGCEEPSWQGMAPCEGPQESALAVRGALSGVGHPAESSVPRNEDLSKDSLIRSDRDRCEELECRFSDIVSLSLIKANNVLMK